MMNTTKFLRLLLEDEDIDLTDEDLELSFNSGDGTYLLHSVFTNCFMDWTREDLLSCFDEDTQLVTEDEWTNNYFVRYKGEIKYGSIVEVNSVFIGSDVTFLGENYYKPVFSNLTFVNSKVVINNPLLANNYIIGESSEVSIINKTGSAGHWGRERLEIAFYQSSDPYKGVKKVEIRFGAMARDNMIELINVPKEVKVNVGGDGVYKNKTLVNGKLIPNPIYLAC